MTYKKADVIVDLQFGSTGKGLIAGFLSKTGVYDTVVSANMPNAGHTFIDSNGRKWVHKALPSGIFVSKNVMIGPGSVFDPERLRKEIEESSDYLMGKRIMIHEAAGMLCADHRDREAATLSHISSTMQGSAACLTDKIQRKPHTIIRDCMEVMAYYDLAQFVVPQHEFLGVLNEAEGILVEGSQGYSLGLSAGFYPYCTSRECTAARVLADCGVPAPMLKDVIGVARVHPIRVGNTADGNSGPCYHDQQELTWEQLGVVPETTTVTGRIRRVFSFSEQQIAEAIIANGVSHIFLNFANYDIPLAKDVVRIIDAACIDHGAPGSHVSMIGVGPSELNVISRANFLANY